MEWEVAAAIIALATTAAFIQALSGFGFALFIVPLLALLIGPRDTVVLTNLLSLFSNGMQATRFRRSADRRTVAVLTSGSIVGMPLGLAVLLLVDATLLQAAIAVMVVAFTAALMRGVSLHRGGAAGDLAAGMTSGILNTSTSMSGPPIVLYLQGRGVLPLEFRATISTFFFVNAGVALVLLAASGTVKPYLLAALALCLPAVFLGQRLGNSFAARIDPNHFRRLVYAILLVTALVAMVGAVLG